MLCEGLFKYAVLQFGPHQLKMIILHLHTQNQTLWLRQILLRFYFLFKWTACDQIMALVHKFEWKHVEF